MKAAASIWACGSVAAGAAGQHHQQRPQALAAAGNDVLGDLVDQRDGAFQARADHVVHGPRSAWTSARISSRVISRRILE